MFRSCNYYSRVECVFAFELWCPLQWELGRVGKVLGLASLVSIHKSSSSFPRLRPILSPFRRSAIVSCVDVIAS